MDVSRIKYILLLALITSKVKSQFPDLAGAITDVIGGKDDLDFLNDAMNSVVDSVGGMVDNVDKPGFADGMKDVLSLMDNVTSDLMADSSGKPPFNMDEHMLGAMNALGPMACIADEFDLSPESLGLVMSGLAGALLGESLGEDASDGKYDMREAFAEMGAIAGLLGAVGGAVLPGEDGQFDAEKFKEMVPDAAEVKEMWDEADELVPDISDMSVDKLASVMKDSEDSLTGMLQDAGSLASAANEKLLGGFGRSGRMKGRSMHKSPGVPDKVHRQSTALASLAGMLTGSFGDAIGQASGKKNIFADVKERNKIIAVLKHTIKKWMKELKSDPTKPTEKLSKYSRDVLLDVAANLGKVFGAFGARAKTNFNSQLITKATAQSSFIDPLYAAISEIQPDAISKQARMLTMGKQGRMDYQRTLRNKQNQNDIEGCMSGIMPILEEIEHLQMLMQPEMKVLDWEPPFHTAAKDSWSKKGLPKFIAGDEWVENWSFKDSMTEIDLPEQLKASDFVNSLIPKVLEIPEIVDFINYANTAGKTDLIDFLKGQTKPSSLPVGALQELPMTAIKYIKNKNEISLDNMLDVIENGRPDLAKFAGFFQNISDARMLQLLKKASDEFYSGSFTAHPKMARLLNIELSRRMRTGTFNELLEDIPAGNVTRMACAFGILDYFLSEFGSSFKSIIPQIAECVEYGVVMDRKTMEGLRRALEETFSHGISLEDASKLHYLINALPLSILMTMQPDQVALLASRVSKYIIPFGPEFHPLVDFLALAATSRGSINDTALIDSLGIVACGLRRSLAEMNISATTVTREHIRENCGRGKKEAKAMESKILKRCMMQKKGCHFQEKDSDMRPMMTRGPLRQDLKTILEQSAKEIFYHVQDNGGNELTREEKREIVRKLTESKLLDFADSWGVVGEVASQVSADTIMKQGAANLTDFVKNEPNIVQKMPDFSKVAIVSKLSSDMKGFLEGAGRLKSLTSRIPNSLLANLDFSSDNDFSEAVSSVDWLRGQALRLSSDSKSLNLNAIRKMGTLALGLTCRDVSKMKLNLMPEIAIILDDQIGHTISPDLAECVALKLFLHIRSKFKDDKVKMARYLATKVPPVFAAFFPTEMVQTLPVCTRFFKRIAPQLHELYSSLAGGLVLQDLAGAAFSCFAFSDQPPKAFDAPAKKTDKVPEPMKSDEMSVRIVTDSEEVEPVNASEKFHPDLAYRNHTYSGRPEDQEDDEKQFFSDQMRHISPDKFPRMGDLLCRIRAEQIKYMPPNELYVVLPSMHHCINKICNATLSAIHEKIAVDFGKPHSWNTDVLYTLGPFVATYSASMIQDIPKDAFISTYDYIRPPPQKHRALTGDKASHILDVTKLFSIHMTKGKEDMKGKVPPVFNSSFSPIKREDFYTIAIKRLVEGDLTPSLIRQLGPDALPFLSLDAVASDVFMAGLGVFGDSEANLTDARRNVIKTKILEHMTGAGLTRLSNGTVRRLGKLSPIFTSAEITANFEISSLETLAALGKARWMSLNQVSAVMDIYLNGREYETLTGSELVAIGNMHCQFDAFQVDAFTVAAFKFALRRIGHLQCFTQDKLDLYKEKVKTVYVSIDGATLQEMGILAAGFSAAELLSFGKQGRDGQASALSKDVNLISPKALKVMPSARIIAGFDESQLARMGITNGGTLLQREDVLNSVGNSTKNAIFASAFGMNAGVYAGFIKHYRNFDGKAMEDMDKKMKKMMEKLQHALSQGMEGPVNVRKRKPKPSKTRPSQAFGLKDVSQAKRPTPPPLAIGMSTHSISMFFDGKFLQNRVVVEMINSAATNNVRVIAVLKGEGSINDIPDAEIGNFPPKILQGLNRKTIQQMSPEKLAILLNSEEISRDPASLAKVLNKLSKEQFKNTLEILSDKMKNESAGIWRPPISIQVAVARAFFRMDHGSTENALNSFLECMCPFSAGVPPRKLLDLPQDENYIAPVIECIDLSYKDLSLMHKRQLLNWVNTMWRKEPVRADKAIVLRNFLLDFPLRQLQRSFNMSDVIKYVNSGMLAKLDTAHRKFSHLSKFLVTATRKFDNAMFNDESFMKNLGRAKCEIRVKYVKSLMDTPNLKLLLDYTMHHCKDYATELKESMAQCSGDAALRLQRCKLLVVEMKKTSMTRTSRSSSSFSMKVVLKRASMREYEMMKDVVDIYLKDKDLTQLVASEVRQVAGAIGALRPKDIDKIPKEAILDNMDVFRNNTQLTKKQKRKIFAKIQSAGFELSDSASVKQLGELVSSVPPKEFKKLSIEGLRESLSEIKKHAASLSPAQKKAIVAKLNEGSVADIMNADLGDLITEIPLSELSTLETIDMDKLKDKPWSRGQAANIMQKFRENGGSDSALSVADIREMGQISVGISCMEIMKILDDEMYDAAQALVEETDRKLTLDMDGCVSNKLQYALQVLNGVEYISNASDPDLASTLELIPEDIAMMMSADDLESIPSTACLGIVENIGGAQLDLFSSGTGDMKRDQLAKISLQCIKDNTLVEGALDESQALVIGQLMCDLSAEQWEEFSSDAFTSILPVLRECFHRLDTSQITYLKTFIVSAFGDDSSQWGEEELSALGPLVAILDKAFIDNIDQTLFYESIDDLQPLELSPDTDAYAAVHYNEFYLKAVAAVMEQRTGSSKRRRRRRKRTVSAPTYQDILVLGPGNVAWSVDELNAITEDDFANSIETLGSVKNWSVEQQTTLVARLKTTYGIPSTWESKVITDAKYLIKGLSIPDLSSLEISDIETCTALSIVEFNNGERKKIIDGYLRANGFDIRAISSGELAGFGSLACGIDSDSIIQIAVDVVQATVGDLGTLNCFSHGQMDILMQVLLIGKGRSLPTNAELYEMGTLAAGLSTGNLRSLPVEAVSFIKPEAFLLMSTNRIKAGLNETQLLAAGVQNVAALMTPKIFDELLAEQRNALRLATYGDDADLEDIPITESPYEEEEDIGADNSADIGDNSGDEEGEIADSAVEDGSGEDGEAGVPDGAQSFCPNFLVILLVLGFALIGNL